MLDSARPFGDELNKENADFNAIGCPENTSAGVPLSWYALRVSYSRELKIQAQLQAKGVKIGYVTLHVGLGTFRPVKEEDISLHLMHSEHYWLPKETAELINDTKKNGGRVIAVGTTSCRTLESVGTFKGKIEESEGWTDIFIYPGYEFKCIDALITNFHLPESTLIMLVSAFCGYENTMNFYKTAVQEKYRFFSFGDAVFLR